MRPQLSRGRVASQGAHQNTYLHQRLIADFVVAYFISRDPSRDPDHKRVHIP
jgi:hypothetical protein